MAQLSSIRHEECFDVRIFCFPEVLVGQGFEICFSQEFRRIIDKNEGGIRAQHDNPSRMVAVSLFYRRLQRVPGVALTRGRRSELSFGVWFNLFFLPSVFLCGTPLLALFSHYLRLWLYYNDWGVRCWSVIGLVCFFVFQQLKLCVDRLSQFLHAFILHFNKYYSLNE